MYVEETETLLNVSKQKELQLIVDSASIMMEQKEYVKAIEHLNRALDIDPTHACLFQRIAVCLVRQQKGTSEKATEYFDKALKLDPHNVNILRDAGINMVRRGKLKEGLQYLDKALYIDPGSSATLIHIVRSLIEFKEFGMALFYFKKLKNLIKSQKEEYSKIEEILMQHDFTLKT